MQAERQEEERANEATRQRAVDFVNGLYRVVLRRDAQPVELAHWVGVFLSGMPAEELFRRFVECDEYVSANRVKCIYPPGHYYSPIVNPDEVRKHGWVRREAEPEDLAGLDLSISAMRAWWDTHSVVLGTTPFPDNDDGRHRYFANNRIFPIGDAAVLRAMILAERPKRIIEIGSGFSSACALDTIDESGLSTVLVLIEPYAQRLRERLRPRDNHRVVIIEKPVQNVEVEHFESLEPGDILFIDSTHVLKTGSDVHYELFTILPRLRPGVLIHFHDMHFPFEYPDEWIFAKNFSWNEVYAVRAFLMYNSAFSVLFMNSLFFQKCQDKIKSSFTRFNANPGGGLWVRKLSL